jgi:hypothetical protein
MSDVTARRLNRKINKKIIKTQKKYISIEKLKRAKTSYGGCPKKFAGSTQNHTKFSGGKNISFVKNPFFLISPEEKNIGFFVHISVAKIMCTTSRNPCHGGHLETW